MWTLIQNKIAFGLKNTVKFFDTLRIRIVVRLFWKLSRKKKLSAVMKFSHTEADTVWQLVHCLEKTTDPRQRSRLFAQILEEDHHAELFKNVYERLSGQAMPVISSPREYLYKESDNVWKLYAYCYVGENEATEKFKKIYTSLNEGVLKNTLSSILEDEQGHVGKAQKMMLQEGVGEKELFSEINRITLKRQWEAWTRMGKRVIEFPSRLILMGVYFLLAPLFVLSARHRMTMRLFNNSDNNFTDNQP